jgi:hypothetical protein
MRRMIVVLSGVLAWAAHAEARPSARAQPSTESMRAHADAATTILPENAEAHARQQAFDARIARKTRAATRSVCQGCSQGNRPNARRRAVEAEESALRTDPAQAPLD